ncbi:MAG: FAD-dependent oxidoreductase, partial [Bacteroidales bacterium]|nr:FAD-dependent oxidoreductase [Bacteroidales bacterium]
KHIETGKELVFKAPVFADCTGDGTIGVLAGADFAMGRESKADYNEPRAPDQGDKMTMGSSVQWYSEQNTENSPFPAFKYGLNFNEESAQKVNMGEWTWETGMNYNQISDFERIRDYGMMVIYSNWSFLKNEHINKGKYANRSLGWVAFVAGKRESRRLLGDIILKEQDIVDYVEYPDATASTSWQIDLHYPEPKNSKFFPGQEFKSICTTYKIYPYPVPYRCLYSRNVDNLFMAGRHISVTHVALGTTRVMRTTGMFGEVVGMAASLCKQNKTSPRGVYEKHLEDLKTLMRKGIGKTGTQGHPDYNPGEFLKERAHIFELEDTGETLVIKREIKKKQKRLTIMGLGDSITEGGENFQTYLSPLQQFLMSIAGYQFEFIGPRINTYNAEPIRHSGFGGKTVEYLDREIDSIAATIVKMNDRHVLLASTGEGFDWARHTISDKVHPNQAGAEKMADVWFVTIKELLLQDEK